MHKIRVFLIKQPSGIYCRHLSFSCVATLPPYLFPLSVWIRSGQSDAYTAIAVGDPRLFKLIN